jgi:hypothetical protein
MLLLLLVEQNILAWVWAGATAVENLRRVWWVAGQRAGGAITYIAFNEGMRA